MKQQPQEAGDATNNNAGTPTSASGAAPSNTSDPGANANANANAAASSNPVSQSQMFYHQTNAPSFYATPQDGPPVGPAMMDQQGQPTSAGMNIPNNQNQSQNQNWNPQAAQGAPTTRSPSAGPNVRVTVWGALSVRFCLLTRYTLLLDFVYTAPRRW